MRKTGNVTSRFKSNHNHAPRTLHTTMEDSADTSRTRTKNKDQHPGQVQIAAKRKRRTKAQIEADNAAKEEKNRESKRKADEVIKTIAKLEGEMAKKVADSDAAHPRRRNGNCCSLLMVLSIVVC